MIVSFFIVRFSSKKVLSRRFASVEKVRKRPPIRYFPANWREKIMSGFAG